tara:strand:- start:611 stop:1126 length:516 start_codon:yes stop_codon:yes gene_type:complete
MTTKKQKDEYWWIHPKFKAKQTLTLDDVNILNENSYDIAESHLDLSDEKRESIFPIGGGNYKDFAKVLFKMNGYKTGTVPGWYVVVALKEDKEWAVAQLKADPIKPILVFKDLIFTSEEKAMMKAAELRISNPGPTRLPGETLSDVPEERRKADSLALKKEFELKLAGVRK